MPTSERSRRFLPVLLMLLTVFGPISMDLYLPALPTLTRELQASTSLAQLTVTACLVGLAVGQLIAGPLSDRHGRRPVLLIGISIYVLASLLCATSPTIEVLLGTRLLQGLAGGSGVVIAQAAGRDVYAGGALSRFYGRLTVMGGLAAVVGPLIGGQLNIVTSWRGLFLFLAIIGVLILIASATFFPETLPPAARSVGGFRRTIGGFRLLVTDRVFLGAALNQGLIYAAVFAYLAGATFVLQGIYGLSPQGYSFAFGLNSVGVMTFGYAAGRATERWSTRGTLAVGVAVTGAGALGLLTAGLTHMPLCVVVCSLFALASGAAITSPPATTIAMSDYPHLAGTASSLVGMARYGFGGIAAPFVGIAGAATILPLGIVTTVVVVLAACAFVATARPRESAWTADGASPSR